MFPFKKSEDHLLPWEKIVFVMVGNKYQQLKHFPQVGLFMQLPGKLDFHKQLRSSHLLCLAVCKPRGSEAICAR